MSTTTQVFLFVGGTGVAILGMTTYLVAQHLVDAGVFNTLAGTLLGGIVALLAPSPAFKAQGATPTVP